MDRGNTLVIVDPVDLAIVKLLRSLPDGWVEIDRETSSQAEETAYGLLSESGLVEQRCLFVVTLKWPPARFSPFRSERIEEYQFLLEIAGTSNPPEILLAVAPRLASDWREAKNKFLERKHLTHARLTRDGELARAVVAAGQINLILEYVHQKAQPGQVPPRIRICPGSSSSTTACYPEESGQQTINAAQANASVGDTTTHTHIHNHLKVVVPSQGCASEGGGRDDVAEREVDPISNGAKSTINERMLGKMTEDPETHGWSARKWADHLGCTKSTVAGTKAWGTLQKMKAAANLDKAPRKTARIDDCPPNE